MIVSCTHSFLGSVFAKDRERFLGPAPAGRQRHPTKPPHVKCRKVMGQPQHLWKSSSSLPHVLMLMHVFYWVPRLTFVRVGIPLWFPSGTLEKLGQTGLPGSLALSATAPTHGVAPVMATRHPVQGTMSLVLSCKRC